MVLLYSLTALTAAQNNDGNDPLIPLKFKQHQPTFLFVTGLITLAVLFFAIFVAFQSTAHQSGRVKVWTVIFAVVAPELFIILHGLSQARAKAPFFVKKK